MAKRKWVARPGARVRLKADDVEHFTGMEPNPLPGGSEGVVMDTHPGLVTVQWDTGPELIHLRCDLEVIAKA